MSAAMTAQANRPTEAGRPVAGLGVRDGRRGWRWCWLRTGHRHPGATPPTSREHTTMARQAPVTRGKSATMHLAARPRRLTIADLTPAEFDHAALCFHEAGHAVVGTVLGGEVSTAAVFAVDKYAKQPRQGVTKFADLSTGREPAVALAGPWAEARWNIGGQRRPTLREVERVLGARGREDRRAITAGGATVSDHFAELSVLMDRCWSPVVTLAQKLHSDREIHHEDVCSALGIPINDNGHHLSLIRGGAPPGSFAVTPPAVL